MTIFEALKKTFLSFSDKKTLAKNVESDPRNIQDTEYLASTLPDFDPHVDVLMNTSTVSAFLATAQEMNAKIKTWRYVANFTEVEEAIEEIINKMISYDEYEYLVKLDLDDVEVPDKIKKKIHESFDKCLKQLKFKKRAYDLIKDFYVDGQLNFEVVYDKQNEDKGIIGLVELSPLNFFKITDKKTGRIKYEFRELTSEYGVTRVKTKNTYEPEQIIQITSGKYNATREFPISYLDNAIKILNQISLIEDSLVIFRITRAPEKRAFYVSTGLPPAKAEEYVKKLMMKYRQKREYDLVTGTIKGQTRSISILEDFWFPTTPNGTGTRVETLSGSSPNMSDLADLDYFIKKLNKALKVPFRRRDDTASINFNPSSDIEREELNSYKFILKLRQRFAEIFIEYLNRDLVVRKIMSEDEFNTIRESIKVVFSNENEYSEFKQLEILNARFDAANSARDLREDGYVSKAWIRKNILKFTDKEIEKLDKELEDENKNEDSNQEGDY